MLSRENDTDRNRDGYDKPASPRDSDSEQKQAGRRLSSDTRDQPNRGDPADVIQGVTLPGTTVGDGS